MSFESPGSLRHQPGLTSAFYRRVRADPILAPVFANLPDDHPHHVALWLGEVVGGPPTCTEEHGGNQHTPPYEGG